MGWTSGLATLGLHGIAVACAAWMIVGASPSSDGCGDGGTIFEVRCSARLDPPAEPESMPARRVLRPEPVPVTMPEKRIVALVADLPEPEAVVLPPGDLIAAPALAEGPASPSFGGTSSAPRFPGKSKPGHGGGSDGRPAAHTATPSTLPSLVSAPPPTYPPAARAARQNGVASVRCAVRPDGSVAETGLQRGTGFEMLDDAAVKAARRWRFSPPTGLPEGSTISVVVTVTFTL